MCWMRSYAVESQKKREVVYTAERGPGLLESYSVGQLPEGVRRPSDKKNANLSIGVFYSQRAITVACDDQSQDADQSLPVGHCACPKACRCPPEQCQDAAV